MHLFYRGYSDNQKLWQNLRRAGGRIAGGGSLI